MATKVDLKRLIRLMVDQKNLEANLILDEGCYILVDDQAPLIKILNYLLNYLNNLSKTAMEISLDLVQDGSVLMLMAYTQKEDFSDLSTNLQAALSDYGARINITNKIGSYIQIKINFSQ